MIIKTELLTKRKNKIVSNNHARRGHPPANTVTNNLNTKWVAIRDAHPLIAHYPTALKEHSYRGVLHE